MLAVHSQYFTGEPDAATSCPSGSEGAGRRRIPAMVQRAALPPYLDPLDQFVKRWLKCAAYLRYVDDLLLFGHDKATLHAWRAQLIEFAAGLRLTFHEERAQVFPVETGIPFLGFRIYPERRRIKRRKGIDFQRRLKRLARAYGAEEITLDQLTASVQGWTAHARYGQTLGLRRAILDRVAIPRRGSAG